MAPAAADPESLLTDARAPEYTPAMTARITLWDRENTYLIETGGMVRGMAEARLWDDAAGTATFPQATGNIQSQLDPEDWEPFRGDPGPVLARYDAASKPAGDPKP